MLDPKGGFWRGFYANKTLPQSTQQALISSPAYHMIKTIQSGYLPGLFQIASKGESGLFYGGEGLESKVLWSTSGLVLEGYSLHGELTWWVKLRTQVKLGTWGRDYGAFSPGPASYPGVRLYSPSDKNSTSKENGNIFFQARMANLINSIQDLERSIWKQKAVKETMHLKPKKPHLRLWIPFMSAWWERQNGNLES